MPRFHIVTLFPEFFDSPLNTALLGQAHRSGIIESSFHNPRDFSENRRVDASPYGGGAGMVMQAEPLARAIRSIAHPGRILLMSASGRSFEHALARELAGQDDITILCGRYEGTDARLSQLFPIEAVSVGDAVFNGGEIPALAVMEAVSRFVPGFMGKEESTVQESFAHGLLEHPHYTRPDMLEGIETPSVLRNGNHAEIALWRRKASLAVTLHTRPDMLDTAPLTAADALALADMSHDRPGRNLSFCLLHYPVLLGEQNIGASSLTNLDIHDIIRISCSYGMGPFYVATPFEDQQHLLRELLRHWTLGAGGKSNPDRAWALQHVCPLASLEDAVRHLRERAAATPRLIAATAAWPKKKNAPLTPRIVRDWCRDGPVLLCLGTAQGLAPEALDCCAGVLRPLRFLGYNHLSVRSAAAILADRILGDYW